nr:ankyrin repeat domain-containing protein 26-like [Taeniopygia guttata]
MSSHALRKRVRRLFSRRRQQRPSSSPCGQPCTAATGASELSDKVQGGLHSRDVPWLRRWRWYFRRFGRDPRGQRRRCFKTALEVNTSNEADVEEDSLRWQEELERVEMELQEVEEKYLNLERCVQNLRATLNDKDREELAAAQELQNQLLAYLENQTTMKGLEEHLQCLEIQNTRLEATVQQQNDKIEALQRDLQASASLREVEEKYLNLERCVQNLMATLNDKDREELAAAQELQNQLLAYLENQTTMKGLEEHLQRLEIQNTRLEATVQQQRDKIEALQRDLQASASLREVEEKYLNSERCVQNLMATLDEKERETAASSLKLQDQLSAYLETVKQLEEHVQRLGFENTTLEGTVQQQSDRIDALQRDLQATTSAQAATQDFIKQSRTSHDSLTNQLKDRIRDLECELERIKDTEQETTFQKQCTQTEVQKYKELYLKEVNISKCQAKELERANERLEEANAKLLRERHKSKSLITSSIVSGGLAATPVLYSTALGHLGNNLGLSRSLSLEGSFLNQCEKILSSRKRFATFVTKVQQELDEKITKELKEATAELETGCTGSSKNLHVDQDPLCRAIEEYRDVLTKDYMI